MKLRDHTFLGATQSLCPDCLAVVPAKIISRDRRVYFLKRCPQHGPREDFVCSDVRWFDRMEYSLPGKLPARFGVGPDRGCPYDCGLCTDHEQHTCLAVFEMTGSCNLTCPMCYATSGPGGKHLPVEECRRAIDALVAAEGRPEVLQLSGGEPTIHPQFLDVFEYACRQPIDLIMINTNGIRFARDPEFLESVADWKHRCEVYLQFDGFDDRVYQDLRGESLLETKLRAIEALGEAGVRVILVCTVQTDLNEGQLGRVVEFGMERPWITGVSFQPATYVGRFVLPERLERRVTFPDVIQAIAAQTDETWQVSDFLPLPCAHPNGHSLAYAYRSGRRAVSLARLIDIENHLDLLANGITFNRRTARELIDEFLSRACCSGTCESGQRASQDDSEPRIATSNLLVQGSPTIPNAASSALAPAIAFPGEGDHPIAPRVHEEPVDGSPDLGGLANEFFTRAMNEDLSPADMFRITTTSFMDAYNFDIRQLMKSCVHHLLPSGHLIPFSAYNVLYRNGHIPLPPLAGQEDFVHTDVLRPKKTRPRTTAPA